MNRKSSVVSLVLWLALIAAAPAQAQVCSTVNGQIYCEQGTPGQTAPQILDAGTSGSISPAPTPSASAGLNSQGIFGCNMSGAYSTSAGAMAAIGGSYVPVNDAAVTLTTGYLVYKQCVLDKMAARLRDSAIAEIVRTGANTFYGFDSSGRAAGAPLFPENLARDKLDRADRIVEQYVSPNSIKLNNLNPAFRETVGTAINRNYYAVTDGSNQDLQCPYTGNLDALITGRQFSWDGLTALTNPVCNPLGAYKIAQAKVMGEVAADQNEMITRLNWSGGAYDVVDPNTGNVITPGFIVAGTIQQQLGASFSMQQNANDMNHMINRMFADIGNILISQVNGGLQRLVRGSSGQPPILAQVVQETARDVRDSAANAGLQILLASRQVELSFLNAKQRTGGVLVNSMSQLRGAESQCWDSLIPEIRRYALAGDCTGTAGNQTCSGPFGIRIATSTAFSQTVISANITALAESTAREIATSTDAFNSINQLLAGVSAANSPEAQQTALRQLDAMVVGGSLHTQYDAQAAETQTRDVVASMGNLITTTLRRWREDALSADPSSGWCKVDNPDVIRMWAQRWRI